MNEARLTLAPDLSAPRRARRFVVATLRQWGLADGTDDVVLLTSELVTNAVLYARSAIDLRVSHDGLAIRVEVHDTSADVPVMRASNVEATGGRGLAMVEEVATAWGVDLVTPGKRMWFEVPTG